MEAAETIITIDLTLQTNLPQHILLRTQALRKHIQLLRQSNGCRIAYRAIIPQILVVAIPGKQQLIPSSEYDERIKNNPTSIKQLTGQTIRMQGQVIVALSTRTINPESIGYAHVNKRKQQCYHIIVNHLDYTVVGFTYYNKPQEKHLLGNMLVILVTQQIRFNTMQIILDFEGQQTLKAKQLLQKLVWNFEDDVYNHWEILWPQRIRKNNINYQRKDIEKFMVIKLLRRI